MAGAAGWSDGCGVRAVVHAEPGHTGGGEQGGKGPAGASGRKDQPPPLQGIVSRASEPGHFGRSRFGGPAPA